MAFFDAVVRMDLKMESRRSAVAGLLLSTLFWGASFPIIKAALGEIDPFFFISIRFVLAALIVVGFLVAFRKSIVRLLNNRILWIVGITNAAGFVMEFYGLTMTTASKASLLVNVNVVFMAIFSYLLLKERINGRAKVGILVGLMGVFLTTTGGDLTVLWSGSAVGDLIIFLGGIIWAYSNIYNKRAVTELSLSPMDVTESMTLTSAIVLVPILLVSPMSFQVTPFSVSALLYVTVICTIFGFFLFYKALKTLTVVNTGIVMLFEIVVAIVTASIFLGETIPPLGAVGGVLIGIGIVLVS
ncbi:MAG: DMT family transporter [Candidatus Verstraetearchaeota archaeon]|nr:DMT family transporter [Candidatus Verstraetearchaeota archaeon]